MCFVRPLKVDRIDKRTVYLENGIKAYYDKKVGIIKPNDLVLVYGNLVVQKISNEKK
jgi:hypothetical protein